MDVVIVVFHLWSAERQVASACDRVADAPADKQDRANALVDQGLLALGDQEKFEVLHLRSS
jgi:hypothetical protein